MQPGPSPIPLSTISDVPFPVPFPYPVFRTRLLVSEKDNSRDLPSHALSYRSVRSTLQRTQLMNNVDSSAQLARPSAVGQLPRRVARYILLVCKDCYLLKSFLQPRIRAFAVAQEPERLDECLDSFLSRGKRRPITDRMGIRPPPLTSLLRCPGDAVVGNIVGAGLLPGAGLESRKSRFNNL